MDLLLIPTLIVQFLCICCVLFWLRHIDLLASFCLLLILVAAVVVLPASPREAELFPVSDGIEYAIGGSSLATDGEYRLELAGKSYPPRFTPGFSALALAPIYKMVGPELGNGISYVTFLAFIGLVAAGVLAYAISGVWALSIAGSLLFLLPSYRYFGTQVMTDVPCTALTLLVAWIYLKRSDAQAIFVAGLLTALAVVFRPAMLLLILPFLFNFVSIKSRLRNWLAYFVPVASGVASILAYNSERFGSPFRSGYNYWMAVPYDFKSLVFSISYLPSHVTALESLIMIGGFLICAIIFRSKQESGFCGNLDLRTKLLNFTLLFGVPLIGFYSVYFYSTPRFYLPVVALLIVLLSVEIPSLLGKFREQELWAISVAGLALVASLGILLSRGAVDVPSRLSRISSSLGSDDVLISGLNPALVEHEVIRGTKRLLIPISRRVEFASKVIAPHPISSLDPFPSGPFEHRSEALLHAGVQEVYPHTALDNPEIVNSILRSGGVVIVDLESILSEERSFLSSNFKIHDLGKGMSQLFALPAVIKEKV